MNRRTSAILTIALLALVTAALFALLSTPRVRTVDIGAPGDAYTISNTYPAESSEAGSLRWSSAESTIHLPGAYAGPSILELRLYRDPQGTTGRPWPLGLTIDHPAALSFEAAPGWRIYRIVLPPGSSADALVLSSPTFAPSARDARSLGVAIDSLRVAPLAGAVPVELTVGRALWLSWLLAMLVGYVWLVDRWTFGAAGASGRATRGLMLLAGLGAALVVWAWRDMASLDWMLPTNLSFTLWGTVGLAGGILMSILFRGMSPLSRARERGQGGEGRRRWWLAGIGVVVLAHAVLLAPLPPDVRGLAAWLILGMPGALSALAIFADEGRPAERALLALAGALGVVPALIMLLHALPGPMPAWMLLGAVDTISLLAAWALWREGSRSGTPAMPEGFADERWFLPGILLGAALRLPWLGSAEFQGDEAYAVMLSKGVVYGQPDILMVHFKGPVEALLPAGPLSLTGTLTEWMARLPFSVAGIALLLGAWVLATRLIPGRTGARVGLVVTLALALDGILIAFGRIVQYQSIVLLMSVTALYLAWRFYMGAERPARYLLVAAFCASISVLAHYDGAMVVPALAWLIIAGARRRGWSVLATARALVLPVMLGLVLTLSFYIPFVTHEHFRVTASHLSTRSGQGAGLELFNNLPGYAQLASSYTTTFQLATLGILLLSGLAAWLIQAWRPRILGIGLAALLIAAGLQATLAPGLLNRSPELDYAVVGFIPPLLLLMISPEMPPGQRALLIWFGLPFLAYGFFVADPRTHFYTMHIPATILAGLAAVQIFDLLSPRSDKYFLGEGQALPKPLPVGQLRWLMPIGGVALLTLGLLYVNLAFLRQEPEYMRAYPSTRVGLFAPFRGPNPPDDGFFGFTQRDGWKVIGELYRRGVLSGMVDSNQELFTSGWYMRGQFMCQGEPDYFIVATRVKPLYIPPGYSLFGSVYIDGIQTIEIYSRAPVTDPPQRFELADYTADFDAAPIANFPLRRLLSGIVPQQLSTATWREQFGLRGFDLDRDTLHTGQSAYMTLYWRAKVRLPASYTPVLLIEDAAGHAVAEAATACSSMPADAWYQTYVNDTSFRIDANALGPGQYQLMAGVRDTTSGEWTPLSDGSRLTQLGILTVEP